MVARATCICTDLSPSNPPIPAKQLPARYPSWPDTASIFVGTGLGARSTAALALLPKKAPTTQSMLWSLCRASCAKSDKPRLFASHRPFFEQLRRHNGELAYLARTPDTFFLPSFVHLSLWLSALGAKIQAASCPLKQFGPRSPTRTGRDKKKLNDKLTICVRHLLISV